MRTVLPAALLGAVLAGCTDSPLTPSEDLVQTGSADGRTIRRDTGAPVQTDSLVYHLSREHRLYSVSIPFRYRNGTGRTIYIVNCLGGLNISLEKRVEGEWQTFYSPLLLACLSRPIEIPAGSTYEAVDVILGALPGQNMMPAFASADLDGEYRLVWSNLVHDYDDARPGFGKPVGPLRSNPFLLVSPGD